jgi:hypothetical protein
MLGAVSYIGNTPLASKGSARGSHAAYDGTLAVAAGDHPEINHNFPWLYDNDESASYYDLHGHLTFNTAGSITHIAPSLINWIATAQSLVDAVPVNTYFYGRVPSAPVKGSAALLLRKRLVRGAPLPLKAKLCTHYAHAGPRVVSAADAELGMQLFGNALCKPCLAKSNSRHIPPRAPAAGAGYIGVIALQRMTTPEIWTHCFAPLVSLTEVHIVARCLMITEPQAVAVIARPLYAAATARIPRSDTRAAALLATIAAAPTRNLLSAIGTVAHPKALGRLNADQLWNGGVVLGLAKRCGNGAGPISSRLDALYWESNGIIMEAPARRVLIALSSAHTTILTLHLTSEHTPTPAAFSCDTHIGEPQNRLGRAESASWLQIEAALGSGHLFGCLHKALAAGSPFATLVEASHEFPAVLLSTDCSLLAPQISLTPIDLANMGAEEAFLANPQPGFPAYNIALAPRVNLATMMAAFD